MFGRVRMYETGFAIFVFGSVLVRAGVERAGAIIGFRILQAVGGAFVTANSGAVISDLFPPEKRGRAYGFNAMCWTSGALLGVLLGGIMVTYLSWRWIFWINVPIGIVALGLALPGAARAGRAGPPAPRPGRHDNPRPGAVRRAVGHDQLATRRLTREQIG